MLSRRAWMVVALAAAGTALPAAAAQRSLGTFRDWSAVRYEERGAAVCMMWSAPRREEGSYTRRGEVFAFVTHRPAAGRRDRVSFEAGYPLRPGSTVRVTIGKRSFELATAGSSAFATGAAALRALVTEMRAGREMIVEGISARGTRTRDSYSLLGFSAAHRAIDRACL